MAAQHPAASWAAPKQAASRPWSAAGAGDEGLEMEKEKEELIGVDPRGMLRMCMDGGTGAVFGVERIGFCACACVCTSIESGGGKCEVKCK